MQNSKSSVEAHDYCEGSNLEGDISVGSMTKDIVEGEPLALDTSWSSNVIFDIRIEWVLTVEMIQREAGVLLDLENLLNDVKGSLFLD